MVNSTIPTIVDKMKIIYDMFVFCFIHELIICQMSICFIKITKEKTIVCFTNSIF